MANSFTRKISKNVGTVAATLGSYTVPTGTKTTVIGLTVANTTTGIVKASVMLSESNGTNLVYIVRDMDLIPGQTQVIVGGEQKLVLIPGDSIRVSASTNSSIDCIMSILEIS